MKVLVTAAIAAAALTVGVVGAQAKPEYATKEKKACSYCHTTVPNLNPRGVYYAAHNHSFEGYDEATVMGGAGGGPKKTGAPAYHSAWKMDAPADSVRIAIGDVAVDKKPRVLVLDSANNLTVYNVKSGSPAKEATIGLGDKAKQFAVLRPAKDKLAAIVVPGAVYTGEAGSFTKHDAPDITDVTGAVVFKGGVENVFSYGGGGAPQTWFVDPTADKIAAPGQQMVPIDQGGGVYEQATAHLAPDALERMGVPEDARKAGVVGIVDPRQDGKLYGWFALNSGDGSYIVMAPAADLMQNAGTVTPAWKSPKLAGQVLDAAVGPDPKGGKQSGILVLEATGDDAKGRTLEFFALD